MAADATVAALTRIDASADRAGARLSAASRRSLDPALTRWWTRLSGAIVDALDHRSGELHATTRNRGRVTTWQRQARNTARENEPLLRQVATEIIQASQRSAADGLGASGYTSRLNILDRGAARGEARAAVNECVSYLVRLCDRGAVLATAAVQLSVERDELRADLADLLRPTLTTIHRILDKLYFDTAQLLVARKASSVSRKARLEMAYLYSGPADSRCRNFCIARVGRVFTRAAIDRMDNGQLPNVFLSRGGWNCRHMWRPVKEPALRALAGRNEFASESLAEQVKQARAELRTIGRGERTA